MDETKKTNGIVSLAIALIIALLLSLAAGLAVNDRIQDQEDARIQSLLNAAVDGNAGYEDVSALHGISGSSLYLVKSGTGGEDSYVVITTAKSRGCSAEVVCTFTVDGLISSVELVKTEGGVPNAKDLIEKSGMLSAFGGISYDSELTEIKAAEGAGSCNEALILAVNQSCDVMKSVLYTEEVSE